MSHPFGDLLRQYRARKANLSLTRLAHLAGYDQAVLTRMGQGGKDLTGPSGRERVVRILGVLRDECVLTTLDEANALLKAAAMPPLFDGQPAEAALVASLQSGIPLMEAATLPVTTPTSMPEEQPRSNLPAPLTSFIGREHEIAEVQQLLATTRLLTLTGAGGCGKTRLALEVGAALSEAPHRPRGVGDGLATGNALPLQGFLDGVWLTELAPLSDPALVAQSVVIALRLPPSSRPALEHLTLYLRPKHLLLILDNCEHLVGACAELVEALLRTCPRLRVLATSREPLNVPGEVAWRVPSLSADEATQLFEERARAATPDFQATPQHRPAVAHICAHLDNIPLAIELAAARLRSLSVEQVAARLNDVFHLLTTGSRTALPRHQTLRAMIDWSYNLLSEPERALLRRLAVFAGGWTLDAAEAVYGAGALDLLGQLVDKSLVAVDRTAAESRYGMLETVRQYAHEKLVETSEYGRAHSSHLAHYADWVESAQAHLHGPQELEWLGRFEAETDNLRAALAWCAQSGDVAAGTRLVDALWYWWQTRGHPQEGRRWIERVLPDGRTADLPRARATARVASGIMCAVLSDITQAAGQYSEALPPAHRAGDPHLIILATHGLGYSNPNSEQGVRVLTEAVRLAQESGLTWYAAQAQIDLYLFLHDIGKHDEACQQLREAVNRLKGLGNVYYPIYEHYLLGTVARDRNDYDQARAQFDQVVSHARVLGDPQELANHLTRVARTGLVQKDGAGVLAAAREAIVLYQKMGNVAREAECASYAAGVAFLRGDLRHAATLLGAANALCRLDESAEWHGGSMVYYTRLLPLVRAALPPAEFEQAWAEGQQMTLDQVIADVMTM